jgi:hypothetical protein
MKIVTFECPICRTASSPEDGLPAEYTAPFEEDPVRALFVKPSFHWNCFYLWDGRAAFARASFEHIVARCRSSPLKGTAYADNDIAVFVSVAEPMILSIVNANSGRSCVLSQEQWRAWQTGNYSSGQSLHPNEEEFISKALRRVWQRFPDKTSFALHTDWENTERHLYVDS